MTKDGFKGQTNYYRCDACGGGISTIDRDAGVTPYIIGCKVSDGCKGLMKSSFYRPPANAPKVEWEWFRPEDLSGYSLGMREHIENGGLDIRRIPMLAASKEPERG